MTASVLEPARESGSFGEVERAAKDGGAPLGEPRAMRRRTIVLSDVHLSQAHPDDPEDPLWMSYRRREHHPDADFAALVDELLARYRGDDLELCFNGDVLDFDAPWVKDGVSSFDEFPLDDEGCAGQAARIVADHEVWFRAVGRLLCAGHRVLFLSGNHDIELYWPGVRRAIRGALGRLTGLEAEELEQRVRFRAWFHVTEDRIYLEHGSQYDHLNCARHAMLPLTAARDWIQPECGKLAFKRTGSRMGYFNPYYEETFYMGLFGYLAHFNRFYARSKHRHIFRTWFLGSVATALEVWKHRGDDAHVDEANALAMRETGATLEQVRATQALRAEPGENTMIPILRELWLDRILLIGVVVLLSSLAFLVGGVRIGRLVTPALLLLFIVYEVVTPKPDIRTYDSAPPEVRGIFWIHGVRAICMGHTHRPFSVWDDEGFYGNSGSWCPAFKDQECTRPVLDGRPFLLLTSEGESLSGGLHWWRRGAIVEEPGGVRAPASEIHAQNE